jgi:hypothetical protein
MQTQFDYHQPKITHGRVLAEICPKCAAPAGELCETKRGYPTSFHVAREGLARYIPNERGEMPPEEYDNEMRGVLFPQEPETDKHPNMTGTVQVNGVKYRLAGWTRESKAGKKYVSLAVSESQNRSPADADLPF